MAALGKALVLLGLVLVAVGLAIWRFGSLPLLGRLPGDIYIRRGNFTLYFPLATAVLVSLVLTLLFRLIGR